MIRLRFILRLRRSLLLCAEMVRVWTDHLTVGMILLFEEKGGGVVLGGAGKHRNPGTKETGR